jgi:hypothetical protein
MLRLFKRKQKFNLDYCILNQDTLQVLYEVSYNEPNFLLYLKKNNNKKILKKDLTIWKSISQEKGLSLEFIRAFSDKLHWCMISLYQPIPEDFIREFKNKVNWELLNNRKNLSKKFRKEFEEELEGKSLL